MRVKYATYKQVENKYLCSECLTRYDFQSEAIRCVTEHNNATNQFIEKVTREFNEVIKNKDLLK